MISYILTKFGVILNNLLLNTTYNYIITFLIAIAMFFQPIWLVFLLLFFAVGLDTISGLLSSRKRKIKITSFRLRDTIIKLFLYMGLVSLIYGIETICLWSIPMSNIVSSFILLTEAVSISENIDVISNNKLGIGNLINKIKEKWLKDKI